MQQMTTFTLRRLSFGAICPDGDCNFPPRAEATGHLDIDGQMPGVCRAAGIQPGDVVVDVGAFVGDTASVFADFGATVHAYEPFLDTFVSLLYNSRGRPIACYNKPAGNGERVKLVYECPGPNYGMRRVVETTEPDCICTSRIDDLRLAKCRLMKIDCEGSEIPTLHGAAETIQRCRPFLFVEMYEQGLALRGFTPKQLEDTIKSLGYRLEMWGEKPRFDWFCIPQ